MSDDTAMSLDMLRAKRDEARELADLAPELYEALRMIAGCEFDRRSDAERCDHIFRIARAALAKVNA